MKTTPIQLRKLQDKAALLKAAKHETIEIRVNELEALLLDAECGQPWDGIDPTTWEGVRTLSCVVGLQSEKPGDFNDNLARALRMTYAAMQRSAQQRDSSPILLEACEQAVALLEDPDANDFDADTVERVLTSAIKNAKGVL